MRFIGISRTLMKFQNSSCFQDFYLLDSDCFFLFSTVVYMIFFLFIFLYGLLTFFRYIRSTYLLPLSHFIIEFI